VSQWFVSFSIGLFCGWLVNVFYVAVKHVWPFNYFGLDGSVDPIVSRNLLRYILFRFVPPGFGFAAAVLTVERMGGSLWWAYAGCAISHVGPVLLAVANAFRRKALMNGAAFILVGLAVLGVGVAVMCYRQQFSGIVPAPKELVANLWAGVLAAVGAIYLQRVVLVKKDPDTLVLNSLSELPADLVKYAIEQSRSRGLDFRMTLALLAVENLQRPKWFRWLELKLPGDRSSRTTGVMQQLGAMDDRQSIALAIDRYLAPYLPIPEGEEEYLRSEWLRTRAMEYNRDARFSDLVVAALSVIENSSDFVSKFRVDSLDR
jgi:uncharacterized membrane protein